MTGDPVPQLVEPSWLESRLSEPDLRVLDCTVHLSYEAGERVTESGYADWKAGHIPGGTFVDIVEELSATDGAAHRFAMPSAETFARTMGRLGVGNGSRVALYDSASNQWAARVWWLLRTFGFDDVGVLDGGWDRWRREDRPVSREETDPDPTSLSIDRRDRMIATKSEVLESIGREDRCLVNCLRPGDYDGSGAVRYGRPGQIPTSVNVPSRGAEGIVDPDTGTYRPRTELRRRFETAFEADRAITYCGGAIAASSVAFALTLCGHGDVAVYDGSLSEWGTDPSLPMESG